MDFNTFLNTLQLNQPIPHSLSHPIQTESFDTVDIMHMNENEPIDYKWIKYKCNGKTLVATGPVDVTNGFKQTITLEECKVPLQDLCFHGQLSSAYALSTILTNDFVIVKQKNTRLRRLKWTAFVSYSEIPHTLLEDYTMDNHPAIVSENLTNEKINVSDPMIEIDAIVTRPLQNEKGLGTKIIDHFQSICSVFLKSLKEPYGFYISRKFTQFYFKDDNLYELPFEYIKDENGQKLHYTQKYVYKQKPDLRTITYFPPEKHTILFVDTKFPINKPPFFKQWHKYVDYYITPLIFARKPAGSGGSYIPKILYQSYYYKIRSDNRGQYIQTKDGRVPLSKIKKRKT